VISVRLLTVLIFRRELEGWNERLTVLGFSAENKLPLASSGIQSEQ
jgi:hypothetical protein